ncbi:hypothetical protein QVD17_28286 [Tagetes erecta]|uniref:Uncharacterized protein n=1 Tax=Tagetes erecta TaxID=13708 RepID=A0AAD8KAQ0_TARER|nr:hypothetical protein QVD17_28286 [Tagetes erecta]
MFGSTPRGRRIVAVDYIMEVVAVTTAIQEEILKEMGVDSTYGLACLGKINMEYENDQDLIVRFYKFVAEEEIACEEAELGPDEYSVRLQMQQSLHNR